MFNFCKMASQNVYSFTDRNYPLYFLPDVEIIREYLFSIYSQQGNVHVFYMF